MANHISGRLDNIERHQRPSGGFIVIWPVFADEPARIEPARNGVTLDVPMPAGAGDPRPYLTAEQREVCDRLGPGGRLIVVKWPDDPEPATREEPLR